VGPHVAGEDAADGPAQLFDRFRDPAIEKGSARNARRAATDLRHCPVIERVHGVVLAVLPRDLDHFVLAALALQLDVHDRPRADHLKNFLESRDALVPRERQMREVTPARVGDRVGQDHRVMVHDDFGVAAHVHIELDGVGAVLEREQESGEGVLDALCRRPSMGNPLESHGGIRHVGVLFRNLPDGKRLTPGRFERLLKGRMTDPGRGGDDSRDGELIAQWKAGDQRAATELVQRHAQALARFAVSAGARDGIDDLVQDTFVRAFGSLDGFRGDSSFRTWLFSIERRLLMDRRRAERRRPQGLDISESDVATEFDALDDMVADEAMARVRDAINRLTPTQREVFVLRVMEGLSYREVAKVVSTTEGAARVHYHNAMRAIKEFLNG
jgi:RNA polymerase sigma-70 factor (ECF subfamily)